MKLDSHDKTLIEINPNLTIIVPAKDSDLIEELRALRKYNQLRSQVIFPN